MITKIITLSLGLAALTFTRIHKGADASKWAATVRLLSTTDTPQKLTATITDWNPVLGGGVTAN